MHMCEHCINTSSEVQSVLILQNILLRGLYSEFLQDWINVFPREQVLVVQAEEYAAEKETVVNSVWNFLQIGKLSLSI